MQCKINDLPDELLEYILSLIPPYKDLQECRLVCKRWYRATKNVVEHNEAHFQKSVAFGSLLWDSLSSYVSLFLLHALPPWLKGINYGFVWDSVHSVCEPRTEEDVFLAERF
ncbi:PREDICTED: F-box only protein 42-like [Wasmannia auropunctata]|uniref:F-box only protein 42-like n=1 Tax=Wasmannia auropunctata TaxID=64793 RepID=UPI0005EEA023|nr:PREDICTED: F-box only protein 42-like [Wasmannia auropunctata]